MNPNSSKRPLIIALVILVIVLVTTVIFLLAHKQADAPVFDNGTPLDNLPINNPLPTENGGKPSSVFNYEDTPESKVVKEESPAYIVAFEKRTDGNWYIGVDYLQIVQGEGFINQNTKIRTFRASPNLKVYQCDKMLNESGTYFTFDQYKNFLTKENGRFINRAVASDCPGTPNGSYDIYVENGQIMTIDEFYDHEVDG